MDKCMDWKCQAYWILFSEYQMVNVIINVNIINSFHWNSIAKLRLSVKFDVDCGAHFNYSKLWNKLIMDFIIVPNLCKKVRKTINKLIGYSMNDNKIPICNNSSSVEWIELNWIENGLWNKIKNKSNLTPNLFHIQFQWNSKCAVCSVQLGPRALLTWFHCLSLLFPFRD